MWPSCWGFSGILCCRPLGACAGTHVNRHKHAHGYKRLDTIDAAVREPLNNCASPGTYQSGNIATKTQASVSCKRCICTASIHSHQKQSSLLHRRSRRQCTAFSCSCSLRVRRACIICIPSFILLHLLEHHTRSSHLHWRWRRQSTALSCSCSLGIERACIICTPPFIYSH